MGNGCQRDLPRLAVISSSDSSSNEGELKKCSIFGKITNFKSSDGKTTFTFEAIRNKKQKPLQIGKLKDDLNAFFTNAKPTSDNKIPTVLSIPKHESNMEFSNSVLPCIPLEKTSGQIEFPNQLNIPKGVDFDESPISRVGVSKKDCRADSSILEVFAKDEKKESNNVDTENKKENLPSNNISTEAQSKMNHLMQSDDTYKKKKDAELIEYANN
jgi:hypothetical protein